MSSVTAGPIYYTAHYSRDTSFVETIANWQYVFRLIGRYAELGVPIGLQIHGIGTSTPFPNTLLGVCCVLETLIAAAQGARSFSLDARLMGNLVQDVAGVRAIREVAEDYVCGRFGYHDAVITIDRKSWSGRYPEDMARAYGIVCYNAMSGMLAGANEFIANSVGEGIGIPVKETNADTLKAIRQVVGMMKGQRAALQAAGAANVSLLLGDGSLGWRDYAPFDAIVVAAASPEVPQPLLEQLAPEGRMLLPLGVRDNQVLTLVTTRDGRAISTELAGARFVPLLGTFGFDA